MGPTIDQYLVANCLYVIDEFNMLYKGWDKPELKIEAVERKLAYFPFLIKKDKNFPNQTKNLTYDYVNAYTESPVRISSERKGKYRCMFIGEKDDKFHFALYYGE